MPIFVLAKESTDMRILLSLFVYILISNAISAQDLPFRMLSTIPLSGTDDLRCIYFDSRGLLWIGTNSGLKQFDGYTVRTFRSDAYSPETLPNNDVLCITEDSCDGLWIGTRNGLARMDLRTNRFKTYHLPREKQRIIYTLFTSADGTVWIGTDGGLTRYVREKDGFETLYGNRIRVTDTEGNGVRIGDYGVKSMAEDAKGNLFVGTWKDGLLRFDRRRKTFVQYPRANDMNSAHTLHIDSRSRLWIGTWGYGIERIDEPLNPQKNTDRKRWTHQGAPGFGTFYRFAEDPASGTLWACCRDGLAMTDINSDGMDFRCFGRMAETYGENLLFSNDIAADGRGNIYVGTLNNGVRHFRTIPSVFSFHELDTSTRAIPIRAVSSIFTADGNEFWLGLRPYGLALYNMTTGDIRLNNSIDRLKDIGSKPLSAEIPAMARRNNGELWIASCSHGVIVVPPTGKARHLKKENTKFITDDFVNTLFAASDGRVWIGAREGVSVAYSATEGKRVTLAENGDDFSDCDVRGFCEDSEGCVWMATENEGIICLRDGQCTRYCPDNGRMPVWDATGCMEDSRRRLWAVSNSGGLFLLDRDAGKFVPVNRRYHIHGMKAFSINEDRQGNIWVATDNGLVRLSFADGRKTPKVTCFAHEDGEVEYLQYPNATFRLGDNMYFGSRKGFVSFATTGIDSNALQVKAHIMVSDILIDGVPIAYVAPELRRKVSEESPAFTRHIVIPSSVGKFAVEFSMLTFVNQEQNKYAYMLEGYDSDWHYQETARQAVFENLPAGTYKLRLMAADSYGNKSELPYAIEVTVLPPWYLSWIAFVIYMLLAAAAVYAVTRWYKGHLKAKNSLAMTSILTNITHELLTPLTVVSAGIDEMRRAEPRLEDKYGVIQRNIQRMSRLLRQILEVRKSQEGKLKLKVTEGNIGEFVRLTCRNIEPMALTKGQSISVDCAPLHGWFDTDKVDKILYNLLSNAIKYNKENGNISVRLAEDDGNAVLTVADEGIGISKDKMRHMYTRYLDGDYRKVNTMGTGLGLSLTHDLVTLHHGSIDCRSEESRGTTFVVTLPMSPTAYAEAEKDNGREDTAEILHPETNIVENTPTATDGESTEKEYTMLIVEDNEDLLILMKRLLGRRYNVLTAKNGQKALNIIEKHELDIVITDVMMPVMDGMELTRKIKDSDDYAQLPVIMLTARTANEDRKAGYETGADEYITKPFSLEELETRVDNIIKNRIRVRQRFKNTELDKQGMLKNDTEHYSSPDELFLQKAIECVKAHIDEYDREQFARDMCVSSSTLYNKLRALTGQNITAFITSIRMKEACRIIREQPDIRVNELSMMVGINTPKYFSKCFKEEFGMLPSEYIEQQNRDRSR